MERRVRQRLISGMKSLLVTGSSGLIGSEVCTFFDARGWRIHGVDNNQRAVFFGDAGDTRWNQRRLEACSGRFQHHELDVRDRAGVLELLAELKPDAIVHTAAQPSHDRARRSRSTISTPTPSARSTCSKPPGKRAPSRRSFTCRRTRFTATAPNTIRADRTRYSLGLRRPRRTRTASPSRSRIDQSKHSLFGASKVAADVMVQEYGRYFGMPTCCLRGGCLTGPNHSGVELHGFLSYLVKCNLEGREYRVFGYKGKQVRDNIHSEDVARFIHAFIERPRSGEVYNIGGGKPNSCSILEAFDLAERFTGKPMKYVTSTKTASAITFATTAI